MAFQIRRDQKASYRLSPEELFETSLEVLNELKWKVKRVDKPLLQITAKVGMSILSWGETVLITITRLDDDNSVVSISSESTHQIVDWGKNWRNIEKFFESIDNKMIGLTI